MCPSLGSCFRPCSALSCQLHASKRFPSAILCRVLEHDKTVRQTSTERRGPRPGEGTPDRACQLRARIPPILAIDRWDAAAAPSEAPSSSREAELGAVPPIRCSTTPIRRARATVARFLPPSQTPQAASAWFSVALVERRAQTGIASLRDPGQYPVRRGPVRRQPHGADIPDLRNRSGSRSRKGRYDRADARHGHQAGTPGDCQIADQLLQAVLAAQVRRARSGSAAAIGLPGHVVAALGDLAQLKPKLRKTPRSESSRLVSAFCTDWRRSSPASPATTPICSDRPEPAHAKAVRLRTVRLAGRPRAIPPKPHGPKPASLSAVRDRPASSLVRRSRAKLERAERFGRAASPSPRTQIRACQRYVETDEDSCPFLSRIWAAPFGKTLNTLRVQPGNDTRISPSNSQTAGAELRHPMGVDNPNLLAHRSNEFYRGSNTSESPPLGLELQGLLADQGLEGRDRASYSWIVLAASASSSKAPASVLVDPDPDQGAGPGLVDGAPGRGGSRRRDTPERPGA